MLRLFRHIRQRHFLKGRVSRYLGYAIGEIVLIVVGILIAVQVGEWRDQRRLERERQELIENLEFDFAQNRSALDFSLMRYEKTKLYMERFLVDILDQDKELTADEIGEMSKQFFASSRFEARLVSYRQAVSSGNIQLLRDNNLSELLHIYETTTLRFQSFVEVGREEFFRGGPLELRKQLGSLGGFQNIEVPNSNAFVHSTDEYRNLFRQKEFYSIYENLYTIKENRREMLLELKDLNQKILDSLAALK